MIALLVFLAVFLCFMWRKARSTCWFLLFYSPNIMEASDCTDLFVPLSKFLLDGQKHMSVRVLDQSL